MRFPFESVAKTFRLGLNATMETDAPVRVGVYLDSSATPFLVQCVRDAFVPETTSALVRVARLSREPEPPKADTDVVLVLSCGSSELEGAVHRLLFSGIPVCVIAESSVEIPFIVTDSPMVGLVAATEPGHLLDQLSRWILDRTDKESAFAANFPFMREAAANRIITSAAITNLATGALSFIPGTDFPVMAMAQVGMTLRLASTYGYRLRPERAYEIAAVLGGGFALRGCARLLSRGTPHLWFVVNALVAGFGTYGMGRVLAHAYARGIDYTELNAYLSEAAGRVRGLGSVLVHDARGGSEEVA